MVNILERIDAELKQASREHNDLQVLVLRTLKSSLHNQEIKLRSQKQELTEDEVIKIFRSEVKKRQEAAELYLKGGRDELASKELAEKVIIEKFLPTAPTIEEVKKMATKLKIELNLTSPNEIGKLTKALLSQFGSNLDGKTASNVAREVLAN